MDAAKTDATSSMLEEMREREEKRNSIILHNVGETSSNTWEEEKAWDVKSFDNVMRAMQTNFTFESAAIFSRRLGKRTEGRPRLLLVGLRSENVKNQILQCAKRLLGTTLSSVSVAPDLTQRQREADDSLREEAARRNSSLTAQDRAKNLRWVVVGRKGARKLLKKMDRDHGHPPPDQNTRKQAREVSAADPGSRRQRIAAVTPPQSRAQDGDAAEEEEETSTDLTEENL